MAKAVLKNLEKPWRQRVGEAIQRCFSLAGVTQKEAAALLDLDPGQVGRWLAGTERPQFDRLFSVPRLQQPLVIAICELVGTAVELETVIRVRRTA